MSLVTNAHVPTFGNFEPPQSYLTFRAGDHCFSMSIKPTALHEKQNWQGGFVFFQTSFSTGGEGESCLEAKAVYYLFFNKEEHNFYFVVNFVNQEKTTRHS